MASNDQTSDVATYAAAVRAALSDLPSDQAEVLLEDLEDHLREIAAETGASLSERLGPPEASTGDGRTSTGDRGQYCDRAPRATGPDQHGYLSVRQRGELWGTVGLPTAERVGRHGDQHLSLRQGRQAADRRSALRPGRA